MLNGEKAKIDELRNILVGKLPTPQDQVAHITTALIYKFLYDMDKKSLDQGGKASFFTGKFAKYAWDKLFNPRLSGADRVVLYREAIENMYNHPTAPEFVREIFKNVSLPFKDSSVLNLFLSKINEFEYSHSEKLGNAYEYLLNFMGSQGDAGQFRTPSHIIDFIVSIVNPQKHEKILDPACGTAGFLISAFNYICQEKLPANARRKLLNNFVGYDISPDMVRLSLVNMYLHRFVSPKIHEYDTLSSEDKWNDYFDVILANPPFFSPSEGGIQPHSRFEVQSKKAEVLFVDYIRTHLKGNGRAGIIVPEGIIFQTGIAYKKLRKLLIEQSLVGVISLPAGIFQPYSGVKTSILILDKKLHSQTENIFFAKIENDGYSLGAQRMPIDGSDLQDVIKQYQKFYNNPSKSKLAISRDKIMESEDCSLSLAKYQQAEVISNFEVVKLGEVCELYQAKTIGKKDFVKNGKHPVFGANGIIGSYDKCNHELPEVLIGCRGTCGVVSISEPFSWITGNAMVCSPKDEDKLKKEFLFYCLSASDLSSVITGSAQPQITRASLEKYAIPLPPIEIQKEIVAELDAYQKIIDGCKQVIENHKPSIDIDSSWNMIELEKICKVSSSKRIFKNEYVNQGIPFYRTKEIVELEKGEPISLELFISKERYEDIKSKFSVPKRGDILISAVGTIGISWVIDTDDIFYFKDGNLLWLRNISENFLPIFIKYTFDALFAEQREQLTNGAAYNALTVQSLSKFRIPNIDKGQQVNFVEQIEEEKFIIAGNKKLMALHEKKIEDRISKLWSKE